MGFKCTKCNFDLWNEYSWLIESDKVESKHIILSNIRTTSTVDYMNGTDWDVDCTCPRCQTRWITSDCDY